MLSSCAPTALPPPEAGAAPPEPFRSLQMATTSAAAGAKKKRRPAGTPGKRPAACRSQKHASNYTAQAVLEATIYDYKKGTLILT